mmetsp:Transcript_113072/g.314714  ORF Transcript_113072/g.314714 Transcript_113072/m.314714 type:complete len:1062 (+) Transcript_113072:155-3340(+)
MQVLIGNAGPPLMIAKGDQAGQSGEGQRVTMESTAGTSGSSTKITESVRATSLAKSLWGSLELGETACMVFIILAVFSECFLDDRRKFDSGDDDANYVRNTLLQPKDSSVAGFWADWSERLSMIIKSEASIGVWEPSSLLLKVVLAKVWGLKARTVLSAGAILHGLACALSAKAALDLLRLLAMPLLPSSDPGNRASHAGPRCCLLAALMLGIHPLRVEVLAWASCLPYSFAAVLSLLSAICHMQHRRPDSCGGCSVSGLNWPRPWGPWRVGSALFLMAASYAKAAALGTVGALGLLDLLLLTEAKLGSFFFVRRACVLLVDVLPLWMVAGLCLHSALSASPGTFSWFLQWDTQRRLLRACHMVCLYVVQQVFPMKLCMFYSHPVEEVSWNNWCFGGSFVTVAVAMALLACRGRRWAFAGLAYVGVLSPSLGLVGNHIAEIAADRYCHLVSMLLGVPLLSGALLHLHLAMERWKEELRLAQTVRLLRLCAIVSLPVLLAVEASMTLRYMEIWAKEERVIDNAVRVAPRYYRTQYIKGSILKRQGAWAEAEGYFRRAVALYPAFVDSHYAFTESLMKLGRMNEAIPAMRAGLAAEPNSKFGHSNLGRMLLRQAPSEAVWHLHRAVHMGDRDSDTVQALQQAAQAAPEAAQASAHALRREQASRFWRNASRATADRPAQLLQGLVRMSRWAMSRRRRTQLAHDKEDAHPYLSFVATSRNDDYAGDQQSRFVVHVAALIHQLHKRHCRVPVELIYVEWNPPEGRPPLRNLVDRGVALGSTGIVSKACDEGALRVRMITSSPSLHHHLQESGYLSRAPMAEYYAKNLGLRVAAGKFVLVTNFDAVYSPALMDFLCRGDLRRDAFYSAGMRFSTEEPADTLRHPIAKSGARLMRHVLNDSHLAGSPYAATATFRPELLPEAQAAFGWLCTGGDDGRGPEEEAVGGRYWDYQAGDFLLAHRSLWHAARAYPEMAFSFGVDSSMLCKFLGMGLRQLVLLPPCFVVHQHHAPRVNPNARREVAPEDLCRWVMEDPAMTGIHRSQRDPELWGEQPTAEITEEEVAMPKTG